MENITHIRSNKKVIGIYKIINQCNGKYYVGSSNHIFRRCRRHKNDLRNGIHSNEYLQRAWNKNGEENFNFFIIENTLDDHMLLLTEQKYLDTAVLEKDKCYNLEFGAVRKIHTEETKNKISKSMKGKPKSGEARKKYSEMMKGMKNHRYGKPQNKIVYHFRNEKTLETFDGVPYDFRIRYDFPSSAISAICKITNQKRKSYKGWTVDLIFS